MPAIELTNSDQVPAVQTALGLRACVILRRENTLDEPSFFTAGADTGAGRMNALRSALQEASLTPEVDAEVELVIGDFTIETGFPLAYYAPEGNVKVRFNGVAASVLYEDADDAEEDGDANIYAGETRDLRNFGVPESDLLGTAEPDILSRFNAARNSLPLSGDPVSEYGLIGRRGVIKFPMGGYFISDTLYWTSFTKIYGVQGRRSRIYAIDDFDNGTDVKYMLEVSSFLVDGSPAHNFNYECGVYDMQLDARCSASNNNKTTCLLFKGAQNQYLDVETMNHGMNGVEYGESCGHIVARITAFGNDYSAGEGFAARPGCYNLVFDTLDVENVNYNADKIGAHGFNLPAIFFDGCINVTINNLYSEVASSLAVFRNCIGVVCTGAQGYHHTSGKGKDMLVFADCQNMHFPAMLGRYFEYLFKEYTSGVVTNSYNAVNFDGARTSYSSALRATFLETHFTDYTREGNTTTNANRWRVSAGGSVSNALFAVSRISAAGVETTHLIAQNPVTPANAGEMPAGYVWGFIGGTSFSTTVNAGWDGGVGTGGSYLVNGTKVIGPRETGWAAMTGTATKTAIATYTAPTISASPTQAEVQALADSLQALSRRVKAQGDMLLAHGLIGT